MAETGGPGWVVLHIGSVPGADSGAVSHPVGQFLSSCSAGVEHCGDVYRGLARLCRNRGSLPRAVVVCADGLGTPELEFFSVVSRIFRRLPVYVYGGGRSRARMARAIQLGAVGEAEVTAMRRLFEAREARVIESPREAALEPQSSPPAAATDAREAGVRGTARGEADVGKAAAGGAEVGEAAAAGGDVGELEATESEWVEGDYEPGRVVTEGDLAEAGAEDGGLVHEELTEEEPVEEGASEEVQGHKPVRVPWLTYSDRPARRAPSNGETPQAEPAKEEHHSRPRIAERPLLTDEELEALIGDLDAMGGEAAEDEEP